MFELFILIILGATGLTLIVGTIEESLRRPAWTTAAVRRLDLFQLHSCNAAHPRHLPEVSR